MAVPTNHKSPPGPDWLKPHRVQVAAPSRRAYPVVDVHDAAAQAAAWARSDREAMYILVSAIQQRFVEPVRLRRLVEEERIRLRRRATILEVIDEFAGGSQSLSEIDLGAVCRRHGLPQPLRQLQRVDGNGHLRSIDAEFVAHDGSRVRVEVEGLQHLDPTVWFKDLKRHNGLVLSGDGAYFRYSAWELRHDPSDFVADMVVVLLGQDRKSA